MNEWIVSGEGVQGKAVDRGVAYSWAGRRATFWVGRHDDDGELLRVGGVRDALHNKVGVWLDGPFDRVRISRTSTVGNLAGGKPMTASGSVPGFPPSNAADSNTDTYWESTNNQFPQWLTVDLGSSVTVSRVAFKINPGWGGRTQTFEILASNDGTNFETVVPAADYVFDPATNNNTVTITFPAIPRRYNPRAGDGEQRLADRADRRVRGLRELATGRDDAPAHRAGWPTSLDRRSGPCEQLQRAFKHYIRSLVGDEV